MIVADDSQFMRIAYRRILETQDHLEVVGMAEDGNEALRLAESLEPDVAILDVRMPGLNGIEVAGRIVSRRPDTGIVIVSAYADTQYAVHLLKTGPKGKAYLLKSSIDEVGDFIDTIEAVFAGKTVLDPEIIKRIATVYVSQDTSLLSKLSETEQRVLALMAQGRTTPAIGEILEIDEQEAEGHTSAIYSALISDLF